MILKNILTPSKMIIILFIFIKSAHSVIFEQTLTNFRDINKTTTVHNEIHEYCIEHHPLYFEYPFNKSGINFTYIGEDKDPLLLVYHTTSKCHIPIVTHPFDVYEKAEKILFNLTPGFEVPFMADYFILPSDIPVFRIEFSNVQHPFYVSLGLKDKSENFWKSPNVLVNPSQKCSVNIPTPPVFLDPRLGIRYSPEIQHNYLRDIFLNFIPVDPQVVGFYSCVESIQTYGGGTFNDLLRNRYKAIKYGLSSPTESYTTDPLDIPNLYAFANQVYNELYNSGTEIKLLDEPQQSGTEIKLLDEPQQSGTEIKLFNEPQQSNNFEIIKNIEPEPLNFLSLTMGLTTLIRIRQKQKG